MNTKVLMFSSSIFLGILGVILTFLPDLIISNLGISTNPISSLSLQLLGALYLRFAMLNWMSKGSIIGGIYKKPIAIGNLMHFGAGALALIKIIPRIQIHLEVLISLAVFYSIFAISFGYIFKTNPSKAE